MTNIHDLPASSLPDDTDVPDTETQVARGSTIEEAIGATRLAFGREVTLREAHRMRRGGLGGFYASDVEARTPLIESADAAVGADAHDHRAHRHDPGQSAPSDPHPAR